MVTRAPLPLLLLLAGCPGEDPADSTAPDDTAGESGAESDDSAESVGGDTSSGDTADSADSGDTGDDPSAETAAYEAFYDPDVVQVVELSLDAASVEALRADPSTYVHASLAVGGQVWKDVGLRLEGDQGWDGKPGLVVKLQEFDGPELHDLERLSFDPMWEDPTMMRAVLAYEAWRAAGVEAPRAGFAEVWVNGAYLGLYANIEARDEKFRKHRLGDAGTLWDADDGADFYEYGVSLFELEAGPDDPTALRLAWEAVQPPWTTDFPTDAAAVFDLGAYHRFLALTWAVGSTEGYPYELDDYWLFLDPGTGLLRLLPGEMGAAWDGDFSTDANRGYLTVYCELSTPCTDALHAVARGVLDEVEAQDLPSRVAQLDALTADAVKRDSAKLYATTTVEAARASLVETTRGWPARVRGELGF